MRKMGSLEYALYLLKIRDRSVGEINHKMAMKGYLREEVEEVILFLKDKNFLDDERFVRNFIKNQLAIKPLGKYRLDQKLKQLYVDERIIKEALVEISNSDEKKNAEEVAEKWLNRKSDIKNKYEKLGRYLVNRGFNYEIIKEILTKTNTKNTD